MKRGPIEHDLKTWPEPFILAEAGLKPWEFRKNDRDFQPGDTLLLRMWNPVIQCYSGLSISRRVTLVYPGGKYGIPEGYVIMSLVEA